MGAARKDRAQLSPAATPANPGLVLPLLQLCPLAHLPAVREQRCRSLPMENSRAVSTGLSGH